MDWVKDGRWLRIFLGFFYVFCGAIKVYPLNQGVYDYLAMKFREYAVVFPTAPLGLTPDPGLYMFVIGVAETSMGFLLAAASPPLRHYSCLGLMAIMVGATQTVICNKDYSDIANPVVCFLALGWVLRRQSQKPKEGASGGADDNQDAHRKLDNNLNLRQDGFAAERSKTD